MNINKLFETIQDEFLPEELNGEFLLYEKMIIWSYNLTDDTEEFDYDDDDETLSFESLTSEELLLEAYQEDIEKLRQFLDTIEQIDNWILCDNEIVDETIIFKIH